MSLKSALVRYEILLKEKAPEVFDEHHLPGATDEQIDALRAAVAPFVLPEDVETLYRWCSGTWAGIFGHLRIVTIDDLIEQRAFWAGDPVLYPPIWLHLFSGVSHEFSFRVLDEQHEVSDPSVWYGFTDDGEVYRAYNSIESLVVMCADLVESGTLAYGFGSMWLTPGQEMLHSGAVGEELRQQYQPGSHSRVDPPEGTVFDHFDPGGMPPSWIRSLGHTPADFVARGATHRIVDLIAESRLGRATGTVVGTVSHLGMMGDVYAFTLDDGTGTLAVDALARDLATGPRVRSAVEIDVVIEHEAEPREIASSELSAYEREFMLARLPTGVPARAIGLRLLD
jgi:hypothetical protein